MTRVIECDGCGKQIDRETLKFNLRSDYQIAGGDIVTPDGQQLNWDHRERSGDLCTECAEPFIEQLNEVLKDE